MGPLRNPRHERFTQNLFEGIQTATVHQDCSTQPCKLCAIAPSSSRLKAARWVFGGQIILPGTGNYSGLPDASHWSMRERTNSATVTLLVSTCEPLATAVINSASLACASRLLPLKEAYLVMRLRACKAPAEAEGIRERQIITEGGAT